VTFAASLITIIGTGPYNSLNAVLVEIAQNAYDADATEVHFRITRTARGRVTRIVCSDNGSGMARAELQNDMLRLGQSSKLGRHTPRFQRPMLGRFGLGAASILNAAEVVTIESETEQERFQVVIRLADWFSVKQLRFPVISIPSTGRTGTIIVLERLRLPVVKDLGSSLARLPLSQHFRVFVEENGQVTEVQRVELAPLWEVTGADEIRWGYEGTERGTFTYRIAVLPERRAAALPEAGRGLEIRQHGFLVQRHTFGYPPARFARVTGYIDGGDWLPITTGRTEIIQDAPATEALVYTVRKLLQAIFRDVRQSRGISDPRLLAKRASELTQSFSKALRRLPEFAPALNVDEPPARHRATLDIPFVQAEQPALETARERIAPSAEAPRVASAVLPAPEQAPSFFNAARGIRVRYSADLGEHHPAAMWDDVEREILINTSHPLYRRYARTVRSPAHDLWVSLQVALALVRRRPLLGPLEQLLEDAWLLIEMAHLPENQPRSTRSGRELRIRQELARELEEKLAEH